MKWRGSCGNQSQATYHPKNWALVFPLLTQEVLIPRKMCAGTKCVQNSGPRLIECRGWTVRLSLSHLVLAPERQLHEEWDWNLLKTGGRLARF